MFAPSLNPQEAIAMNVIYEPHPVTPERKAELRAGGYKIIDARFAPDDAGEITRESIAKMKRADVVELLEAHGLTEADCEGTKLPELRDMLISAMFVDM